MQPISAKGLRAHGYSLRPARCGTRLALLGCISLFVAFASASPSKDSAEQKAHDYGEHDPAFTGGLYEYRRVGTDLVGLWREYTAMSDALSHALRDYNVAIRQEQRAELARVLAHKHDEAETSIAEQKSKGRHTPSSVLYGELASLKELKRQMKRLDRKVGQIPDYRHPEENVMLIQGSTAPVNVSSALSHNSASLFHKAVASYHRHVEAFYKTYQGLRSFLYDIKMSSEGSGRRNLIKQAAELGNFFDTEAPIALHFPMKK